MTSWDIVIGCSAITVAVYIVCLTIYGIVCSSYMTHIYHNGIWRVEYEHILEGEVSILSDLFRDWGSYPFVDAIITSSTSCPSSHPEDLVYDMWPGTRGRCDCL